MSTFIDQTLTEFTRQPATVQRELFRRLSELLKEISEEDEYGMDAYGGRIVRTPGVVGGSARINDRRLAVYAIIECYHLGYTDEEQIESHPYLVLEDLVAAKAYYADHKHEIEMEIALNNED